jgi:hypothetical protein
MYVGRGEVHIGFWRVNLTKKKDNIKMDLQEVGWRGKDWIDLSQIRDMCQALVNAVMNRQIP